MDHLNDSPNIYNNNYNNANNSNTVSTNSSIMGTSSRHHERIDVIHFPKRNISLFPQHKNYLDLLLIINTGWICLLLVACFVCSWTFFAFWWWLITVIHGDRELIAMGKENQTCLGHVSNFASIYLFSIETQHTIGYGYRYINDTCPFSVVILMVQCLVGVIIECLTTGLLFIKICYPKKREQCIIFSNKCLINQRDDDLYLAVRIADTNKISLIDVSIRAELFKRRITHEGDVIPFYPYNLTLCKYDLMESVERLNLILPQIIMHCIDRTSPMADLVIREDDIIHENFQIVFSVNGYSKLSGIPIQAQKSYYAEDLIWGHRFVNMIKEGAHGEVYIDFLNFHLTTPINIDIGRYYTRCTERENFAAQRNEYNLYNSSPSRNNLLTSPENVERLSIIIKENTELLKRLGRGDLRVDKMWLNINNNNNTDNYNNDISSKL